VLLSIPNLLDSAALAECRKALEAAEWVDGSATAGYLSRRAKNNMQVPENHPVARRLGAVVLDALDRNQLFISAALPLKIVPPLFNRYSGGQSYGSHIDGAVRPVAGTPHRVRTDLSATLFLSDPADYDGGELVVEHRYGAERAKLAAGDLVLYPGSSIHHIAPVTRGTRLAAFFWVQSMVRDDMQRSILFDLDTTQQDLARGETEQAILVRLAGTYHNLLRMWSDT
jgi:PKHD-type hydroxylase